MVLIASVTFARPKTPAPKGYEIHPIGGQSTGTFEEPQTTPAVDSVHDTVPGVMNVVHNAEEDGSKPQPDPTIETIAQATPSPQSKQKPTRVISKAKSFPKAVKTDNEREDIYKGVL